ncbi:MAG: DNA cytosine methyltransferase [Syntrophales bacterium]|nr:DNA cytosine methyltransferase [Syntrophales bacterium]
MFHRRGWRDRPEVIVFAGARIGNVKGRPVILRTIEFFSGIGGFAAAVSGTNLKIVTAFDQSPQARATYRLNFPRHPISARNLEHITKEEICELKSDFWWLSPPCQPYTVRGNRKDADDPRAASLKKLTVVLKELREDELPTYVALENVEGFVSSRMREWLIDILESRGFESREFFLCPTRFGVPMRRPRYYLLASRKGLRDITWPEGSFFRPLKDYLEYWEPERVPPDLLLSPAIVEKFGRGFHIIDPENEGAYATCFTSAYGHFYMRSGSYLKTPKGVRFFSPTEIMRLLGFPDSFSFPSSLSMRHRWRLLGNSLSVTVVRHLLECVPQVEFLGAYPLMIISGGQTGADRAALDFALANGIPHGGWVPRGRRAEDGPLDMIYHVWETEVSSYSVRTEKNVLEADGTLIISHGPLTGGSSYTRAVALGYGKPWLHIDLSAVPSVSSEAEKILRWMKDNNVYVLNVAGPRASTDPLIYDSVLQLLRTTFRRD